MARHMGGTYIGPRKDILGKHAMLQEDTEGKYLAQFDERGFEPNVRLISGGKVIKDLAYGWHEFPAKHFLLDPQEGWDDGYA